MERAQFLSCLVACRSNFAGPFSFYAGVFDRDGGAAGDDALGDCARLNAVAVVLPLVPCTLLLLVVCPWPLIRRAVWLPDVIAALVFSFWRLSDRGSRLKDRAARGCRFREHCKRPVMPSKENLLVCSVRKIA